MSEHEHTPTAVDDGPEPADAIASPAPIDAGPDAEDLRPAWSNPDARDDTPRTGIDTTGPLTPAASTHAPAPQPMPTPQPVPAEHTQQPSPPAAHENEPTAQADEAATEQVAPEEDPGPPTLPKLDRLPRPQEPRLIALINQKGGVGKTTTTVNLGAALAASGLRVLMIDLDPQAHLTLSLGIDPETVELSIYDLLTDRDVTASEVVRMVESSPNLGVLPAETNLAGVESELAEMVATGLAQTILRNKTADLIKHFDYVLLDCPPSLGLLTINGLTAAKEIIVPMQAHFLALQGMGKLFETINMIRQGINPSLTVAGVVLCMHEANTILASDVVADVEGFFEEARGTSLPWANAEVYDPPIRRNIKLAEAPSFGQSVLTYASESNGAKDYAKLARSVAKAAV
ncbi:MAG: AAA family ATPase [Phycisphaerales bacterium JB063]